MRRLGSRSSRGPNSKEWWGSQLGSAGIGSTTVAGWVINPDAAATEFESPTIIRLIVHCSAFLVTTAPSAQLFAFGLYVATGDEDEASTLPTPLWDPNDDQPSDWIYRWLAPQPAALPSGIFFTNLGADLTIQSLAKRKIPKGAGLLGVMQQSRVDGGVPTTVNFAADVRVLLISG